MSDYVLETERLLLRCLQLDDAARVVELAGEHDVAKMTLNIPHPYPPESAVGFIEGSIEAWKNEERFAFAITDKVSNTFMGVIGLHPEQRHKRAMVGYWIGKPYWGKGYMTEALKRVIQFAFEDRDLNRVEAAYHIDNPASGRVMEKAGMLFEGTFPQYYRRDDKFIDLHFRAILRENYLQSDNTATHKQVDIQPIETEQLLLRCIQPDDAPPIATLINDYDIAKMTRTIPYPYPPEAAITYVINSIDAWENHKYFAFAIVQKETNTFMGVIGIHPEVHDFRAEVGYWIGKRFWNNGYVTEALQRVIQFGFETLNLNRIEASYRADNVASSRVMEKIGMQYEGTFRQMSFRDGEFHDLGFRAILREDYDAQNS